MMPTEAPDDAEQARLDGETEDVESEYEPDPYDQGYELTEYESAIADEET